MNQAVPIRSAEEREARRKSRRAKTPFTGYFHNALRVADMEATRHFYEDVIGLPLTGCEVVDQEPGSGRATSYIHTFFELSDGSLVAFFQFDDPQHPYIKCQPSHMDHCAIAVRDEAAFWETTERVKTEGIKHFIVDHPDCLSNYIVDPDGRAFEIAFLRPNCIDGLDHEDAHEVLANWLKEHGGKQLIAPAVVGPAVAGGGQ